MTTFGSDGNNSDPIDRLVGEKVRMRRMVLGISQKKMGQHLGVTFRQVEKYERGTNRIFASRLYEIAQFLDVDVSYFFQDLPGPDNDMKSDNDDTPESDK